MASESFAFVSIIVLNWNGKRFIDGFFDSIAKQTYPQDKIEILFVDNASSDDSVTYFESKHIPNARLIQTGDNYGYSGGNNFGFREAKGDYVAVCNNDLELAPTWLEELIKVAAATDADVVVPKLVYAESRMINNAGSILVPNSDWPNKERGMGRPADDPEFNEQIEVTAFCGASPLFKRSFLHDVGLFDRRFFLYWEDGDLSWRGQKAGKKYIYAPRAIAYHHTSGSTGGEQSPVFIHYVSRNRVLILIKHGQPKYIAKAFAKVGRDHVLYKVRDLYHAITTGSGRKSALRALIRGIKILGSATLLAPVMLAKRWKILKEETL
jgi:GT2 family glycosyltransferase